MRGAWSRPESDSTRPQSLTLLSGEADFRFDLQGHRGARGLLPENSVPAFRRAAELGVTTLEMDVVVSRDREVVVSHDPHFDPTFCSWPNGRPVTEDESRRLRLYDMSYAEIAAFDCGILPNPEFPGQKAVPARKPLLREVIAMAEALAAELGRDPLLYNIETKSRKSGDGVFHPPPQLFTELLYGVLSDTGVTPRAVIQSFDYRTLRAARQIDPAWRTSLLTERFTGRFVSLKIRRLGFLPEIYSPDYRAVTSRMIARVHELGMQIIPWTVNDGVSMRRLAEMGVDGLITDYPDIGVLALERFLAIDKVGP